MLTSIFSSVLNMSLTASIVIAVICLARLTLKTAPKIYSYMLWGLVLFRLLCPVSFLSSFSLIPDQVSSGEIVSSWEDDYVGEVQIYHDNRTEYAVAVEAGREPISADEGHYYVVTGNDGISEPNTIENTVMPMMAKAWILGMAAMILYSVISYARIRKQTRVAVPFRKNIYIADDVASPFVIGFVRPVIYLPGTLERAERKYIIAHERHHIRRGDHIFKALGFLALTIHWFNPLVWIAFVLAGRDMEMSCDEAVIRKYGEDVRADYSASLLNLATGHRLFAGTPLAFDEGDPTGRVRNLAKWKKPTFWVILVCMILCVVLAVCLLTNPETAVPDETEMLETVQTLPSGTETVALNDWGVSLVPDRVSRTGATALFAYSGSVPGEDGAELTYGDFLSLERLVDGNWVACDELAGYDYYVGDSSYPVVDGYGMVHEWQNRFGELIDGHYRIGKMVTLTRPDGSREEKMIYGEFVLPNSVRTGLIPLEELPDLYSAEQAMIDGCFVQQDGVARDNKELFQDFAACTWNGMPGVIRIVNWHYGEDSHWSAMDLNFDGTTYTLTSLENSYTFKYLKRYTGVKAWENADHDAFEYYVLVNDDSVTWEDIHSGKLDMSDPENPAHWTVYADFTYTPKQPQLPMDPAQAGLEFNGEQLITVTDFDRLEKIWILFGDAELLGYEPKTHSIGIGLNLVLKSQSGETMTIELDPGSDICRINGEYVFYGAYDEPDYIEKLWYYLGIEQWPDQVYEKYPNAFRP